MYLHKGNSTTCPLLSTWGSWGFKQAMMLFCSSCSQDRAKPWEIAVSMVKVKQVAHRGGHCSEVKSFTGQHLLQDVNNIQVLSFTGILLKLLHMFPVLHRQMDLQREKNTKGLNYSRALFECEKRMTTGLLWPALGAQLSDIHASCTADKDPQPGSGSWTGAGRSNKLCPGSAEWKLDSSFSLCHYKKGHKTIWHIVIRSVITVCIKETWWLIFFLH